MTRAAALALALAVAVVACTRPGEDRVARDLAVGAATIDGATVDVAGGLAHVRALVPGAVALWAQAPVLELAVELDAAGAWTIEVANALPDAELVATSAAGESIAAAALPAARPTVRAWTLALPAGVTTVRIAPPDAGDVTTPWRFAVMGDIQGAMPEVDEVFARIDAEPGVRFVVSTGDIVDRGQEAEYELFERQLATLDVPFYSTIGNHELFDDVDRWYRRYGRANVHFRFRAVTFTLIDSASATIDPAVDRWLDAWLAEAAGDLHLFGTHYPPVDPVGVRQGSFASRREGQALLARLAAAGVDLTVYGHIHTYVGFDNAGIPAYISGGGGAQPLRLDGIGRHFLAVDVDPTAPRFTDVRVVRVD